VVGSQKWYLFLPQAEALTIVPMISLQSYCNLLYKHIDRQGNGIGGDTTEGFLTSVHAYNVILHASIFLLYCSVYLVYNIYPLYFPKYFTCITSIGYTYQKYNTDPFYSTSIYNV
jgi:hypothetical protein